MRVLTVGTIGERKGSRYVVEAASQVGRAAEFRMVGPITIERDMLHPGPNVRIVGPVPRSEIAPHFEWADLFLLPSLCEGSATSTYEALSSGLPVICTHNTGSVVRDGIEGFIVPVRNSRAIAERIEQLAGDDGLLSEMSENAARRGADFSDDRYGARLVHLLDSLRKEN